MEDNLKTFVKGMLALIIFVMGFFVLTLSLTGFQKLLIIGGMVISLWFVAFAGDI